MHKSNYLHRGACWFFVFFFSSNKFRTRKSTFLKVGNFYSHLIRREDCESQKVHETIKWHPKKSTYNNYETWWEIEKPPPLPKHVCRISMIHTIVPKPRYMDYMTQWKDKTRIFSQNMSEKNTKLIESPKIGIQSYK